MKLLPTNEFLELVVPEIATKKVLLVYRHSKREVRPEILTIINETWSKRDKDLDEREMGEERSQPLYRYESHSCTEHELKIVVSDTDYRETYGTNIRNPYLAKQFGLESLGNALAVCGILLGSNGRLLLVKRSEHVHDRPGWWHSFGGHLSRSDEKSPESSGFIEDNLKEELMEELLAPTIVIRNMIPTCFVRSRYSLKPEICYTISIDDELTDNLPPHFNFEHKGYEILPATLPSIARFLEQHWENVVESTKALLYHFCRMHFSPDEMSNYWDQSIDVNINSSPHEVDGR